jgi:predicted  nucleic acid-binding Zn-ribbon protein
MKFFKKKDEIVDLGEHYNKQQEKLNRLKENLATPETNSPSEDEQTTTQPTSNGIMGFFGGMSNAANTASEPETPSHESTHEKKRKLARRLMDMTDKIEDLTNQVYHLQQRIEVLERKNDSGY